MNNSSKKSFYIDGNTLKDTIKSIQISIIKHVNKDTNIEKPVKQKIFDLIEDKKIIGEAEEEPIMEQSRVAEEMEDSATSVEEDIVEETPAAEKKTSATLTPADAGADAVSDPTTAAAAPAPAPPAGGAGGNPAPAATGVNNNKLGLVTLFGNTNFIGGSRKQSTSKQKSFSRKAKSKLKLRPTRKNK